MARLRGFCINLPEQEQRRQRLLAHLQGLPLPGEDGLWRSVLALLEQVCSDDSLGGVDLLHIVEDDAELSPHFCRWIADLDPAACPALPDLLFTDMYTGPTVFPRRQAFFEAAFAANEVRWLDGSEYTGCTTSWLVPVGRLALVQQQLRQAYDTPQRIPIDNLVRRLLIDGALRGAVSAPFLTSIDLASQVVSAIQDRSDRAVAVTSRLADLLRRHLSVLRDPSDLEVLWPLLAELLTPSQLSQHLGALIDAVQQHKGFRYSYDPRLLDQPGNQQASRPQTASACSRSAAGL